MQLHAKTAAALFASIWLFAGPAAAQQAAPKAGGTKAAAAAVVHPDLIYHPVVPCRVFDTKTADRIPAGQTRNFVIAGDVGFPEQGGAPGGCGVPPYAYMVTLSLTAQRAEQAGFASTEAVATPKPRLVSFPAVAATTAGANALLNDGALSIYSSAAAHFVGDVTGYFAPQLWAMARPDGQLYMSSGRFTSSRRLSTGVYEVTADRDIHICGAVASAALQNYYATAITDLPVKRYVTVKVFDPAGQPADAPFNVMVKC